ncbi:MAG TPA: hypothetical protein VI503_07510, partial [Gaiellaceae bacterium]|nr:hypothetical protein [Gaiellaceae bacterium]
MSGRTNAGSREGAEAGLRLKPEPRHRSSAPVPGRRRMVPGFSRAPCLSGPVAQAGLRLKPEP